MIPVGGSAGVAAVVLVVAAALTPPTTPMAASPAGVVVSAAAVAADVVPVPRGRFGWPLTGFPTVVRGFDPPAHRYGRGHRGVDLAGRPEQAVLAAGDGVVVFAATLAGRGVVSVDHEGGLRTTYEPVAAVVTPGQRVLRGQQIGTLEADHPGCAVAACLHWGLRRGRDYLDPLRLLAAGRVRLLPISPVSSSTGYGGGRGVSGGG